MEKAHGGLLEQQKTVACTWQKRNKVTRGRASEDSRVVMSGVWCR